MNSSAPASCQVLAAILLGLTAAAPAGELDFGKPGPYAVGVRTIVLIDQSRKDEFTGGPRTLVTEVWYPAVEEARGMPKLRFSDFFGPYRDLGAKALKRDLAAIDRDFHTLGIRGAGIRDGRWPLLVFSHGNGGFRHQNVFQMDHLASHGYVVAAPDHTGNASLTPLPGGAVGYDRKGRARSAEDRPRDVSFLIDRLSAGDVPETTWVRGMVEPAALGVLGHSFGGFTAVRVGATDPRIRAVLAMTVAFPGEPASIPTMVMLGAEDNTVGLGGNLLSRGYFLGLKGPRYLFVLKRGGHFTYSEMAVINPNFGDGVGHGKVAAARRWTSSPLRWPAPSSTPIPWPSSSCTYGLARPPSSSSTGTRAPRSSSGGSGSARSVAPRRLPAQSQRLPPARQAPPQPEDLPDFRVDLTRRGLPIGSNLGLQPSEPLTGPRHKLNTQSNLQT